jgi:hypothetical protein
MHFCSICTANRVVGHSTAATPKSGSLFIGSAEPFSSVAQYLFSDAYFFWTSPTIALSLLRIAISCVLAASAACIASRAWLLYVSTRWLRYVSVRSIVRNSLVFPSTANTLKTPVICFLVKVLEYTIDGIIADWRFEFPSSVHYLCQCFQSIQWQEFATLDDLKNSRNNHSLPGWPTS